MAASPWFLCLEERARELIKIADELLVRYTRQRRRAGISMIGRVFSAGLRWLREYERSLSEEERQRFIAWDKRLCSRLEMLRKRRIPPCRLMHKLYLQCRSLRRLVIYEPEGWDAPSVLVGTLRRPSQLDVCLMHGFYHVPVGQIPEERLPVDYVAIYQSRAMFRENCGICFYGRVKSCTVVKRWEISEIPKASDALYYRFEVLRWQQLEEPVRVREVPFTHLFTNLFLLTHASETPELLLKSYVQYCRYQAIRVALSRGDGEVFTHPGGRVWLKNGYLQIRYRRRKLAAFRAEDFVRVPDTVFRQIMTVLNKNAARS